MKGWMMMAFAFLARTVFGERVGVIGGGISGLYTALRLKDSFTVEIFERTSRCGGRVQTEPFGTCTEDETAEFGPMRIGPGHSLLLSIARELGIDMTPFGSGGDSAVVMDDKAFSREVLGDGSVAVDSCFQWPQLKNPCSCSNVDNLRKHVCETMALYKFNQLLLEQRTTNSTVEDFRLRNVIRGYDQLDDFPIHWSSRFREEVGGQYVRPVGGIQQIITALVRSIGAETVRLNLELTQIEKTEEGKYRCTFRRTSTDQLSGVTRPVEDAEPVIEIFDRVVLAGLPGAVLEWLLAPLDEEDSARELLDSVEDLDLLKIYMEFQHFPESTNPVITELWQGSQSLLTMTSGSLQQIWKWHENSDNCAANTTVLQLYITLRPTAWRPYLDSEEAYMCAENGDLLRSSSCAGLGWMPGERPHRPLSVVFDDVLTQLSRALDVDLEALKKSFRSVRYRSWSPENPRTRTTGVTFWKAGTEFWRLFARALQPLEGEKVHIMGDRFSYNQGWMQGAVETVEYFVQEILGVPPKFDLSQEEYCWLMPFWTSQRKNFDS